MAWPAKPDSGYQREETGFQEVSEQQEPLFSSPVCNRGNSGAAGYPLEIKLEETGNHRDSLLVGEPVLFPSPYLLTATNASQFILFDHWLASSLRREANPDYCCSIETPPSSPLLQLPATSRQGGGEHLKVTWGKQQCD
jgi:hypothetical protein